MFPGESLKGSVIYLDNMDMSLETTVGLCEVTTKTSIYDSKQ